MKNKVLLKGIDLTYSKEASDFKTRMLGNAGDIYLKDVNIHLYEGEVLGLLSFSGVGVSRFICSLIDPFRIKASQFPKTNSRAYLAVMPNSAE